MKSKLVKLVIAGMLAGTVVVGGVQAASAYQQGNGFKPFPSNREMKSDQLLFPESDGAGADDQQKEQEKQEDSFWERDDAQEESARKDEQSSNYLFEQENQQAVAGADTAGTIQGGDNGQIPDGAAADVVYDIIDGDSQQVDTILPGGNGNGTGTGSDSDETDKKEETGKKPGKTDGTSGSSDREKGNGTGNSDKTDETPVPAPVPEPEPAAGFASTVKDPEVKKTTPSDGEVAYPINPDIPSPEEDAGVTVNISPSTTNTLYVGQKVYPKDIYRSLDTYIVVVDWTSFRYTTYYWLDDDYGKLFRIDGISFDGGQSFTSNFPVEIKTDEELVIRCSYRTSEQKQWTEQLVSYTPSDTRFYVLSQVLTADNQTLTESQILNKNQLSPKVGTQINLFAYQESLTLPANPDGRLTRLFPGWKRNGKKVPFIYTVSGGRQVLEPMDLVEYDSSRYEVRWVSYWVNNTDYSIVQNPGAGGTRYYTQCQLQTLLSAGEGTDKQLVVPDGTQIVDIETSTCSEWMQLPDTVIYVNTDNDAMEINQGYSVSSGNPRYASQDGVLYNKQFTELLGIPYGFEELDIPTGVEKVVLPEKNKLKKLILHNTDIGSVPEINYDNLAKDGTIAVPAELLQAFVTKNQKLLAEHNLHVVESGADTTYFVRNGVMLGSDGNLKQVLYHGGDVLFLPEGVTQVSGSALQEHGDITTLVLPPDGVEVSFPDGLAGSNVQKVYCYTQAQLDAAKKQLPDSMQISLLKKSKKGYVYYKEGDAITLIAAPKNLTEFEAARLDMDGTLVTVADGAFSQSTSLQWVILPETVKSIGSQAFYQCSALEGLLIDSKDAITIGKDAFESCPSLRFLASNAKTAQFQDGYEPELSAGYYWDSKDYSFSYLFCLPGSSGYPDNWENFENVSGFESDSVEGFKIVSVGENSRVLCGYEETYGEGDWLVLRAGKTMPDTVELPDTIYWFYQSAFAETCSQSGNGFSISLFENKTWKPFWFFENLAFFRSELSGSVRLNGVIVSVKNSAFTNCGKVKEVELDCSSYYVEDAVFQNCTSLTRVLFGESTDESSMLSNYLFGGCTSLQSVEFRGKNPPELAIEGITDLYTFNSSQEEAEQLGLRLIVPEGSEETYINAWRNAFMGTTEVVDSTPYWELRIRLSSWYGSNEELDEAMVQRYLEAENHLRKLLGMEKVGVSQIGTFCNWNMDYSGFLTLTSVYTQEERVTLDGDTLGFPEGWTLDYIGANAFGNAPNLTSITAQDSLAGIDSGAFANAPKPITLDLQSEKPVKLRTDYGGTFDFTGLENIRVPSGCEQAYLNAWIYPMAGYLDYADMYLITKDVLFADDSIKDDMDEETVTGLIHEKMQEKLLPCENELRELLGMEQVDSLTVEWKGELDTDFPDFPDFFPEFPDSFETPEIPDLPEDEELPEIPDTPEEDITAPDMDETGEDTDGEGEDTDSSDTEEDGEQETTPEDKESPDGQQTADEITEELEETGN